MSFALTRTVFEEHLRVTVSTEEAAAIEEAVRGVSGALSIEEKFNLLLENFAEFESELLQRALDRSLFRSYEWTSLVGELHHLNRRLVNFLATARLYLDQVPHNLSTLFGQDSPIGAQFVAVKHREYEARLGYRVMEALRNYMQHRSLPIHFISHRVARREFPAGKLVEHIVTAEIRPEDYREDGKFKADVLKELEALGERVELPPLVREYVAGLASLHAELRTVLASYTSRWDGIIRSAGENFLSAGANTLTGLALVELSGDRTYRTVTHISAGPVERRKALEERNRHAQHYERVLVANRSTAEA
jgi:hypothetical protein